MLDKNLLLVDIGGTNIRYAYSNIGDSGFVSENKAELDSLNDFDNLMSKLLAESDVKNIVFSVAGPKLNNSIKMTNRNFEIDACLLYTSPSPRDLKLSRMPSSA